MEKPASSTKKAVLSRLKEATNLKPEQVAAVFDALSQAIRDALPPEPDGIVDGLLQRIELAVEPRKKATAASADTAPGKLVVKARPIDTLLAVTRQATEDELNQRLSGAEAETIPEKQDLAKIVTSCCRRVGAVLEHPETGNPCTLLAVGDRYGGSFVLEDRKTKKRSKSTRDIKTLLPLKLIPLPDDA